MFDRFGEFDSYREINTLAENLFNEGDLDSLRAMAKENGLDREDVEAYLTGELPELCEPLTAALGKLEEECRELQPREIMEDWVEYIRGQCLENDLMARQVRRKGKSLRECIAKLLQWSFGHQQNIDKEVLRMSGIKAGRVTIGIPGMGTAKRLIKDYYMGTEA